MTTTTEAGKLGGSSRTGRAANAAGRRLLSILMVLVIWFIGSRIAGPNVLPGPPEVIDDLFRILTGWTFLQPLASTLLRTVLGFLVALVIGVTYGVLSARVRPVRQIFAPIINLLLFFPTLGIVLIGLVVLGAGTMRAAVTITALAVFPTVGVFVRDALMDLDEGLIELADSYKIRGWRRFIDLYLPYLTPTLLGAGRISFNVSWKVILLAEVFGFPGGLGFQVRNAFNSYQMQLLMAWLVVFVTALLLIEQAVRLIERRVVRWT